MPGKKILVVDDSRTSLMIEQMILQEGRYTVLTATDGQDALLKALRERPDLILMDVVMPRMNGLEAVRALREQEATRATPVIMVTTRSEGGSVEAGYQSGCNDYVTKPVDAEELLSKVRNCLGE